MSVLIKGMEMPKACSDCFAERCIGSDFGCDILGFDDANTTCFTNEIREDCPLLEIPPHGRLIDADALIEAMARMVPWAIADPTANAFLDGLSAAYEAIQAAPTIIPAEEE